jgi:hypothetical protein
MSGPGRRGRRWAGILYRRAVALYPSPFRKEYGRDIELLFNDLASDPAVPAWRLWLMLWRDFHHSLLREHLDGIFGGASMVRDRIPGRSAVVPGVVCGFGVLLIWFTFRYFHVGALVDQSPLGREIASMIWVPLLLSPLLLFAPAGFFGVLRTGTLGGGLWAGLVAGLIASLTVPGDYLMRHNFFPTVTDAIFTIAMTAAVCMFVASLGAAAAVVLSEGPRKRFAGGLARWLRGLADAVQSERARYSP